MSEPAYDATFYADLRDGARRSARAVLPMVFDRIAPESVVDFGCGSGGWLAEAEALGAKVFGLDGPWVPQDALEIAPDRFQVADLMRPLDLDRRFDLALCLEVAEHLPAASAEILVGTLTDHAPAVLFSAAVPGQGGTDHVNEAWPDYWHSHFAQAGFVCDDTLRPALWTDERIEPWYRQNLLLFIRQDKAQIHGDRPPRSLVHPGVWSMRMTDLRDTTARLRDAEAEIVRLGHAWQDMADAKARLESALREQEAALASSRSDTDRILHSRSWRLTAPLRRLDAMLRRQRP